MGKILDGGVEEQRASGPCWSSQHEPKPPHAPLGHNGSYPEDKDDEDDNALIDSSFSLDEVISDDEDEGVDGFGHEISRGPAAILEPFDPQFATSYWPRWDGNAIS